MQIKKNYAEVYKKKGDSLRNLNRFEESLENYQMALKLRNNYPKAYHDTGVLFIQNGLYAQGVEYLLKAIS